MEGHEREPGTTTGADTGAEPADAPGPAERGRVPMSDLLASCAAADAVSTPPVPGGRPDGDGGPRAEAA